jgi:hypothetical protein
MRAILLLALLSLPAVAQVDGGVVEGDEQREHDRLGGESAAALLGGSGGAGAFTLSGYAEAFYQWNFNQPANGVTDFRGFDNRHNSFTLSNVVLDARWDFKRVIGRVAFQVGHTPSTYYLAEPGRGGGAASNRTDAELWKYLQQANVGYSLPLGPGVLVEAGLFLSPIGPEAMQVKENWNWSRSNLFFGLPFYHAGVRASAPLGERWSVSVGGYNGWNSVVDNNDAKSLAVQATYTVPKKLAASVLYFGGIERSRGAAEGPAWRHLFDAHVTWLVTERLSLLVHGNAGLEPNALGTAWWAAGALYARVQALAWLFVAARADVFMESVPARGQALFWSAPWMASQTLTVDLRPHPQVSARVEYRHDEAGANVFFGLSGQPTQPRQDTLTLGLTTWF